MSIKVFAFFPPCIFPAKSRQAFFISPIGGHLVLVFRDHSFSETLLRKSVHQRNVHCAAHFARCNCNDMQSSTIEIKQNIRLPTRSYYFHPKLRCSVLNTPYFSTNNMCGVSCVTYTHPLRPLLLNLNVDLVSIIYPSRWCKKIVHVPFHLQYKCVDDLLWRCRHRTINYKYHF